MLVDNDEPDGIGNWMIGWNHEQMIKRRIACPEAGYPFSEALYGSIEEWEKDTGLDYWEDSAP